MSSLVSLFGSDVALQSKTGTVQLSSLDSKTAVLLYFSAHWCPPCRKFTPVLAEYYNKFAADKGFEIIFVSSDKDQGSFDEYYGSQPWLALPYDKRELKDSLSKIFKVQGIPTLVVLGSDGSLITTDGRTKVMTDTACEEFPWRPLPFCQVIAGPLVSKTGDVDYSTLTELTAVGLYFSAHWCPPCRAFTPKLVEYYNKMKGLGKSFEIIFVSSDKDKASFEEYYAEMPWLSIPFGDKRKEQLSAIFKIEGIPSFVILEPSSGNVITANGRSVVSADPEGVDFPWWPKPLQPLDAAGDYLNESACLIYLNEEENADELAKLQAVATAHVDSWKAAGKKTDEYPLLFFHGKTSSTLANRILSFANLPTEGPLLFILNIPEGNKSISKNPTDFENFASEFVSGSLDFVGLKA